MNKQYMIPTYLKLIKLCQSTLDYDACKLLSPFRGPTDVLDDVVEFSYRPIVTPHAL